MNFKNKYLLLTIRTLFGLWVIVTGLMGFLMATPEGLPPAIDAAVKGIEALGISGFIAFAEIIAGLMIVTGYLPALGNIMIAPITVGIIVFHAVKDPAGIIPGIIFAIMNLYLGYAYWDKYKALFKR